MRNSRPLLGIVAAAALVAGCGPLGSSGPTVRGGDVPYRFGGPATTSPSHAAGTWNGPHRTVVVRRGDTLYGIAKANRVPVRTLIEANGLQPPYALEAGRRLTVPAVREHEVARGDTLSGIARAYNVDIYELARLNDMGPPYVVRLGIRLLIPDTPLPETPVAASRPEPPAPPAPSASASSPTVERAALPPPPPVPPPAKETAAPAARVSGESLPASPPAPHPAPADTGGRFLWPVGGRVVLNFGPRSGGVHNDGINIEAPRGAPIRAAADGVVAYVGNELRGFGNLLLVKHAGGWMTAYAHADALLVRKGDKVARGQEIARVGSTGSVATPQLHFEIRKGSRPVDPMEELGAAPQVALAGRSL